MFTVAALYQFAPFEDPAALREPLQDSCNANGVKGTLLLAKEGINGTIAGTVAGIAAVLGHIRSLPRCAALEVKFSTAARMPFHRMKVRTKAEIVTLGVEGVDPARDAGHYVEPSEWNALLNDPATIVIDTRNDYEVAMGSFPGALDPRTTSFSEFPKWFRANRASFGEKPKIAMFCTGGIRCEKSTAFLRKEGIDDVAHLKGGILKYLETMSAEDSLWKGECFVFDERVAVTHGLQQGTYTLCRACRNPVAPEDRASEQFIEGIQCPRCAGTRTDQQKQRYAERHKQVALAGKRGTRHVGDVEG